MEQETVQTNDGAISPEMFESLGNAMYNEAKLSETDNKLVEKALQEAVDELNQKTNNNECCESCDKECEEKCVEECNVDVDVSESKNYVECTECTECNECEKSFEPFQVEEPIYVPTYTSADYTGPQFSAEIMTETGIQPEEIKKIVMQPLETTDLPEGPNVTPIIRAHESDVYTFFPQKTLDSKVDDEVDEAQTIVENINDKTLKQVLADMESEKQQIADTIESDNLNTKEKSTTPDDDCEGKECSVEDTIKCECKCDNDKEISNNFKRYAKIGGTIVVSFVVAAFGARFFFS